MKTYYFEFESGWIGGIGVVVAENIHEALLEANTAIENCPMSKQKQITINELTECMPNECAIISNGDY